MNISLWSVMTSKVGEMEDKAREVRRKIMNKELAGCVHYLVVKNNL